MRTYLRTRSYAAGAAILQIKCCVCLKKNFTFACTLYCLKKGNSFHVCNREEVSFLAAEKQQPPHRCLTRKTEQNCKFRFRRFLRYSLPEAGRTVWGTVPDTCLNSCLAIYSLPMSETGHWARWPFAIEQYGVTHTYSQIWNQHRDKSCELDLLS